MMKLFGLNRLVITVGILALVSVGEVVFAGDTAWDQFIEGQMKRSLITTEPSREKIVIDPVTWEKIQEVVLRKAAKSGRVSSEVNSHPRGSEGRPAQESSPEHWMIQSLIREQTRGRLEESFFGTHGWIGAGTFEELEGIMGGGAVVWEGMENHMEEVMRRADERAEKLDAIRMEFQWESLFCPPVRLE
ncbi:MAG: hypothetical protein AAGD22_08915 [Verrucomicrobiota bacterium]